MFSKRLAIKRSAAPAVFELLESRQLMSAALPYGVVTAGSIGSAKQSFSYTFAAPQGADVNIDTIAASTDSGFDANFVLRNPSGGTVQWTQNGVYERKLQNLSAGTYTLTASDYYGKYRGTYSIGLEGISPTNSNLPTLTNGGVTGGQISGKLVQKEYTFKLGAAQTVELNSSASSIDSGFDASFTLYTSAGAPVKSWTQNTPYGTGQLPLSAGTYMLKVSDYYGKYRGNFSVGLWTDNSPFNSPAALTNGAITTGQITGALVEKQYAFTLKSAETLVLNTIGSSIDSGFDASFQLYRSNGAQVKAWTQNTPYGTGPLTLPADTYMLKVSDYYGKYRGNFSIGLEYSSAPFSNPSALARGGITGGQIAGALEQNQYTFTLNSAETIALNTIGSSIDSGFDATFDLYSSNGTQVKRWVQNTPYGTGPVALAAGTYMLKVSDYAGKYRGNYSVGLEFLSAPFSPDAKSLSSSVTTTGTVAAPLDHRQYTFAATGPSATFVTTGSSIDSGFDAKFEVYDSKGALKGSWTTNGSYTKPITGLTAGGNYVLMISDYAGKYRGNYTVKATGVKSIDFSPTIASLSSSATTIKKGSSLTLTAESVADAFNDVTSVVFYRESNGQAGLQTGTGGDAVVATDTSASGGYTATSGTASLTTGTYTFYAEAFDANGAISGVVSVKEVVN